MDRGWRLVGRADELELLAGTLTEPGPKAAVLFGEAGVGKTRLATEFLRRAATRGWATHWIAATRSVASVAFGAFAPLLPAVDADQPTPWQLMARVVEEIRRRASARGLVLGVDDAHLLDQPSAALVHAVASSGAGFVVATVRAGETAPDSIVALWKDGLGARVDLRPLTRAQTAGLLTDVLGGQVDSATLYRLWQAAQGNVLFLRELVHAGLDRGALACRAGVWTWAGDLACGERLTELVEQRLNGLDDEGREVLELLALGEPLGPAFLGGDGALERLERAGLVKVSVDGRRTVVRLAHPLYAETLRSGMGVLRRRAGYAQLAATLGGFGARRRGDVLRQATWQLQGGGDADPGLFLDGARRARALCDHGLAERLADAAVAAGAGRPAPVQLADSLFWQGRYVEAQHVLERLPARTGPQPPDERVWEAIVAGSCWFWGAGDAPRADRVLGEAIDALAGHDHHRAQLGAHWASLLMFNGRVAEALARAEPVMSEPNATALERARALVAALPAWAVSGRGHTAVAAAEEGLSLAVAVADDEPVFRGYVVAGQATAHWLLGDLDAMERLARKGYEDSARRLTDDLDGLWALQLARAALARGRPRTAIRLCRESAVRLHRHDVIAQLPACLAVRAIAHVQLSEVDEARAALAEATAATRPAVRLTDTEVSLAKAWSAAAGGERSTGRELALGAADQAGSLGLKALQAMALHDAVRLGATGCHERLSTLAETVDGALVRLFAEHATALALDHGDRLERAGEAFAGAGMALHAAEAFAHASSAHGRAGLRAARRRCQETARAMTARCEGAITPALRAAFEPDAPALTDREREMAELAAAGLTDRQIADRLVVSVRTVGNHLNHVYAKLGVRGRAELTPLLTLRTPLE